MSQTILITGTTGYVGYAVLAEALRKGYNVRAAVRSQEKADFIRKVTSEKLGTTNDQLSFTIVKDITLPGAFDDAVTGMDGIIHVASPLPQSDTTDFEEQLVKPAVEGTVSILYSALKEPKIQKVVITSSIVSIIGSNFKLGRRYDVHVPIDQPEGPAETAFDGYIASKAKSRQAAADFLAEQKPHFKISQILPAFVFGRNDLATSTKELDSGSNRYALDTILGRSNEGGQLFLTTHVDDVAFVHVAALSTDSKYDGDFSTSWKYDAPDTWDTAIEYTKESFPEEVKSGLLPANGHVGHIAAWLDSSETEEVFGLKFKSFKEQITDLVGQYVELAKRET